MQKISDIETCLFPLFGFYQRAGRRFPEIQEVPPDRVPEPYHQLLVHNGDMTPTLKQYHGDSIHLSVLDSLKTDTTFSRKVLLVLDSSGVTVEFGAICFYLESCPTAVSELSRNERAN